MYQFKLFQALFFGRVIYETGINIIEIIISSSFVWVTDRTGTNNFHKPIWLNVFGKLKLKCYGQPAWPAAHWDVETPLAY